MANRRKAGELNASMIIQSFKDTELLENPAAAVAGQPDNDKAAGQSDSNAVVKEETGGVEESPATDTPKSKPRKRRGNYDEVFLKRKELKTRQPVYISQSVHKRIKRLVKMLSLAEKEISVGGYIDNVLEEHLDQYNDEIDEMRRDVMNS
jgi:hypothetical protein